MRKLTIYIIFISTAIIAGYDLWPALNTIDGDTISEILRDWAPQWPIVPTAVSVLMGHWFIHPSFVKRPKWGPFFLIGFAVFLCLLSLVSFFTTGWLYVPAWIPALSMWTLGCTLWKLEKPNVN